MAPSLWVASWKLINCTLARLEAAERSAPDRREVGAGGIDSFDCCDGIFVNVAANGSANLDDGCTPLRVATLQLVLVRPCVARGVEEGTRNRVAVSVPPEDVDPCDWEPSAGTWHGDQMGLFADLDALLPAMGRVTLTSCDGTIVGGTTLELSLWEPYLTGPMGTCQGWLFEYQAK